MKKRIIIGTSIVAILVSVCFLVVSVYAIMSRSFEIKNSITFGGTQNLAFSLKAQITGTNYGDVKVDNNAVNKTWNFELENANGKLEETWDVGPVEFRDRAEDEPMTITYIFDITNSNNCKIRVLFTQSNQNLPNLDAKIEVQTGTSAPVPDVPILNLNEGATGTIRYSLEVIDRKQPASANININLTFEPWTQN